MKTLKMIRDHLLFWSQIYITIWIFTYPQIKAMMKGVEGFVLTSFLFVACYCSITLWFVIKGWVKERAERGRASMSSHSMLIVWVLGVLIYGTFTVIFIAKSTEWWNPNDTTNTVFFCGGIAGVWLAKTKQGLGLRDPRVRFYLAICLRVIPQVSLGLNILAMQSATRLTSGFVLGFHALLLLRLMQNLIAIWETKHDPNRKYVFVTETAGWASWWVVTLAWIMYR